jgi:hypothetical protein
MHTEVKMEKLTASERAELAWLDLRRQAEDQDGDEFGWSWVAAQLRARAEAALMEGHVELAEALRAKADETGTV